MEDFRIFNFFSFFSDVTVCAHSPVSLHLLGMSSHPEVFSVHINGQVLQQNGHKVSSVGLISSSTATVSMVALHTGRWLISSLTVKHIDGNGTRQPKTAFTRHYVIIQHIFTWTLLPCSWNARVRRCKEVQWLWANSATDDHRGKTTK